MVGYFGIDEKDAFVW